MSIQKFVVVAAFALLSACASSNGTLVSNQAESVGGNLFVETSQDGSQILVLDGEITPETSFFFQTLVARSELQGLVIAQSPGGTAQAAHLIGRTIRANKINTLVLFECFSACVEVFAAGNRRGMVNDATLGLHSPTFFNSNGSLIKDQRRVKELTESEFKFAQEYWTELGYPRSIMDRAFQVPAESIWVIEAERARSMRIATEIIGPEDN